MLKRRRRHWLCHEVALPFGTSPGPYEVIGALRLDTFRNHPVAELVSHLDNGSHQRLVALRRLQFRNECPVHLQDRGWELLKVGKIAVATPKSSIAMVMPASRSA